MIAHDILQGLLKGLSALAFTLRLCAAMIRAVTHCFAAECAARMLERFRSIGRHILFRIVPRAHMFAPRREAPDII